MFLRRCFVTRNSNERYPHERAATRARAIVGNALEQSISKITANRTRTDGGAAAEVAPYVPVTRKVSVNSVQSKHTSRTNQHTESTDIKQGISALKLFQVHLNSIHWCFLC
jgi:hypothetical protein